MTKTLLLTLFLSLAAQMKAGVPSFFTISEDEEAERLLVVDEYVPAPGQFINTMPEATAADTPETMARKCTESLANGNGGMVSLGGYGGYITLHFRTPVVNIEGEYDMKILGNAHTGSAECGIVMVSQDTNGNGKPDDEWYELAGSADIDSVGKVDYDYEITYKPAAMSDIPWTDNRGNSGKICRVAAHSQEYYPLWISEPLTFSGTRLPNNAADISGVGAYYVLSNMRYGYVDNLPNSDVEGNSFNIDWAVNSNREPVRLTHIDFIRIYSALNQQCGWLGESSTEVSGAEDLHPQASSDFAASLAAVAANTKPSRPTAYNLAGQRVSLELRGERKEEREKRKEERVDSRPYKGIVIMNGKKICVR